MFFPLFSVPCYKIEKTELNPKTMSGQTPDGFYELTSESDNFQLTPGLLVNLPGGLLGL